MSYTTTDFASLALTDFVIVSTTKEDGSQFARVEIAPMRVIDRNGVEVEVTDFWLNGHPWYTTAGYKIKKDGTLYQSMSHHLDVPVPECIRPLLDSLATTEEN